MTRQPVQSLLQSLSRISSAPLTADRKYDFDSLFIEAVYKKFTTGIIMDMQYIWELYRKGFDAAQKSNFDIANYYFKKGEEMMSKSNLNEEVLKYLNIYITPKLSYYYYKKADFKTAEELTWKALYETEYIETEFPNMHMGKIQQLHNIVRVLVKQNRYSEAHQYECDILNYLMFNQVPQLSGEWNISKIDQCDQDLVSLMIFQVLSEKVVNTIAIPGIDQKQALSYFALLHDFKSRNGSDHHYNLFTQAIKSYIGFNADAFITYTEEFFVTANIKFNAFKHYLIFLYVSLLDPNMLDLETEEKLLESLQSNIRVTPRMLGKYQLLFESLKQHTY